ncbi:MAG: hypothetical protein A3G75_09025 [Verrucomicrobia bacterium RIFCSPLOWO2_12_FULL_64_8]|nr:MAG: hypothetical protein A3G75_09025 [Verrucomicrobia bacterium RIFCSPLOWO2_12_FULL_64_8]
MKSHLLFLKPTLAVAAMGLVAMVNAQYTAPAASTTPAPQAAEKTATKAAPAQSSAKPSPGTPPATKPDPKKKAEEEMGKIPGLTLTRANGTFLGLTLEGGNLKLSFYDEKKKPSSPDVPRAVARWNPRYKLGEDRTVLNPAPDGKSLLGVKIVRPPYNYKIYLTLIKAGEEGSNTNNESYVVDAAGLVSKGD